MISPALAQESTSELPVQYRFFTPASKTQALLPSRSISSNFVANLHTNGDSLWVGPRLNLTTDGGATWFQAEADSVSNGQGRVFSIDIEGNVIWAGLGFDKQVNVSSGMQFEPTALGFVVSEDGGQTFSYRFAPLDRPGDTTEVYGISTLPALDVIVPEQSPPFDIDYDPLTGAVWTAGWASGIRRSLDGGRTWQRMVLPPDTLNELRPDVMYNFEYSPRQSQGINSKNFNFSGFAVLVDETGTVWTGSAAGLNRSTDAGTELYPTWRRFSFDGSTDGLLANWIISIEEQPLPERNAIWMTNWPTDQAEQFGIVVTRDGGETFEQVLIGEKIYDFAFQGETVYAAGDRGVFITEDNGLTWHTVSFFFDPNNPDQRVRPDVQVFSVAVTRDALWAGTSDGLFKSTDAGLTWIRFRTDVPLHPDTPTADVPDVEAYAYPNPYSPSLDGLLRIRYELDSDQPVTIRIFDFGMTLVRALANETQQRAGTREATWDARDNRGIQVANGAYFYAIEGAGDTIWGKILVLD